MITLSILSFVAGFASCWFFKELVHAAWCAGRWVRAFLYARSMAYSTHGSGNEPYKVNQRKRCIKYHMSNMLNGG